MRRIPLLVVAALVLLGLAVAPAAEARAKRAPMPTVTSVSPMRLAVGQTLVVRGRHFRPGKGRNSLGFKRDGSAIVFVKAGLSTRRMMQVKLPAKLERVMGGSPTRFRLRVLTSRFAKSYTARNRSPLVSPRPAAGGSTTAPQPVPAAAQPEADCDADGQVNRLDTDDDNDGLDDVLENRIGTDACAVDTDGDTVQDGYEYRSAIDLNDDEYRAPQASLPYPGKRPYPNPLDKTDANIDHDGDGLTLVEEQTLWKRAGTNGFADPAPPAVTPLSYSAGMQYSVSVYDGAGRRVPSLDATSYSKWQDFLTWASNNGYGTVTLHGRAGWPDGAGWHDYALRDVDRSGTVDLDEQSTLDHPMWRGAGVLSDDERDEDADGLSNFAEIRGYMTPEWWTKCYGQEAPYPVPYVATDPANEDSDGDGVRDGADDQDFDDVPNIMEVSRIAASGITGDVGTAECRLPTTPPPTINHPGAFGWMQPFNPCKPDPDSRTCRRYVDIGSTDEPTWWALN